jgi:hypothetical protein
MHHPLARLSLNIPIKLNMSNIIQKILIFFFLFSPFIVFAETGPLIIDIDVQSEVFLGDDLKFNYSIYSAFDQNIQYIPKIDCKNAPVPALGDFTIFLEAGIAYENNYYSMKISDFIEPQECTAIIEIIEPTKQIKEKKIKIVTNPILVIEYLVCQDEQCLKRSKVSKAGAGVFLNFMSDVAGVKAQAEVIQNKNIFQTIKLPGVFYPETNGNYQIKFTANADGYKESRSVIPLTVLGSSVEINDLRICNADGICSEPENEQNCPQDCNTSLRGTKNSIIIFGFYLTVLFLIAIILFFIYKKSKI